MGGAGGATGGAGVTVGLGDFAEDAGSDGGLEGRAGAVSLFGGAEISAVADGPGEPGNWVGDGTPTNSDGGVGGRASADDWVGGTGSREGRAAG